MNETPAPRLERIVGEVSKSWLRGQISNPELLSQAFEEIIETNRRRGYRLESWQFSQMTNGNGTMMNETIIAVFVSDKPTKLTATTPYA